MPRYAWYGGAGTGPPRGKRTRTWRTTINGTPFSLRTLLRQVRDELSTGDQHHIAKEAITRIPSEYRDRALLEALTELARTIVNSGHPQLHTIPAGGARTVSRSAKIAGIRRAWPELRATYSCVDASLQLADYSIENLLTLAGVLETQAKQTAAKAKNFRKLAKLMEKTGVTRVADLPDVMLAAVFRGEAAA